MNLLLMYLNRLFSQMLNSYTRSVGIIGGADGPTSIMVSSKIGAVRTESVVIILAILAFIAVWFILSGAATALITYYMVKKHKTKDINNTTKSSSEE